MVSERASCDYRALTNRLADYKFPPELVKIPCYCGASTCRGSLN